MHSRALFLVVVLLECEIALFHNVVKTKKNKNNKTFVGSMHKFRFLTYMAIKDEESALGIAWGSRYEQIINKEIHCW